ncbi:cofilin/tropomyosin-type actin-binding domain-containing protein [Rhizoctonia solani AG-1 IA]|uniref:Cofilin/tropomyosin-type actin-binding domain-containing protein n=1 Tax=Thanatephorus cucumeris (strain AG1-IA) TaxID=983506 RepID=L8X431_THACA|nr:cofilin/tropomyosin-type actin-binding domain-containing protein [Rhizoctonia solani AG-1 IA]
MNGRARPESHVTGDPGYGWFLPHDMPSTLISTTIQTVLEATAYNQSQIVEIPQELKDSLRKFRFARRNAGSAALVVKINKQTLKMEEVEQFDSISMEDLAEELPDASPRYVVLSYELKHDDGRTSFPLVLINWTPQGSETGLMTLHASALIAFQNTVIAGVVLTARVLNRLWKYEMAPRALRRL